VKIVMLGHTGVGKTTYLASLYGSLQREVEGFSLRTSESRDHDRLIQLANTIGKGEYPLSTDQRSQYQFQLKHQSKNILDFTLADYRGGAIRETQDSQQAKLLLQDLSQADGIIMFCDCSALTSGDNRSNQLARMMTLVNQSLQNLQRPLSLAIILTKIDLVTEINESQLRAFSGIISAIEASEWVFGAFIPIACGGKSINVPIPLLFALHEVVTKTTLSDRHSSKVVNWSNTKENRDLFQAINDVSKYPSIALIELMKKLPLIQKGMDFKKYNEKISKIKHGINLAQTLPGIYGTSASGFDAFN
jgi:GTPase SAR1 family protein